MYDKAGNSKKCSANQTVKIDKTEPTCGEIKISGTEGDNNWYKSNVTISATDGSDTLSGHKSTIVSPEEIKNNTTGTSVKLTTEDNAGNKCTKSTTIKIDKTKPNITCTLDNNNLTSGINVAVSATDKGGSGLKKYQNSYLNMTETFKITVKDNAGNKNSCDVNIESIAQTRNRTRTYEYKECKNSDCGSYTTYATIYNLTAALCKAKGGTFSQTSQSTENGTGKCVYPTGTAYNSCRTKACGEEAWGDWSAWSNQTCEASNLKQCQNQTIYSGVIK